MEVSHLVSASKRPQPHKPPFGDWVGMTSRLCQYYLQVLDRFYKKRAFSFKIFPHLHFWRCSLRKTLQYTMTDYCLPVCLVYIEYPGMWTPGTPHRTYRDRFYLLLMTLPMMACSKVFLDP